MIKRILTGAVLVGLVSLILLFAPIILFKFIVLALIGGALFEFFKLVMPKDFFSQIVGIVYGLGFAALLIFNFKLNYILPIALTSLFVLILIHMIYSTVAEGVINKVAITVFGVIYLSCTLVAFSWLREVEHGRSLIVFTFAIVAVSDTFAYAFGKMLGKHKMSPLISPNKTMEGFVASFFGGVIASILCWQIFWPELTLLLVIVLGLTVAFIGAFGDLIESLIKRGAHVKDSGNLLPGHGGVLDRVDALIFAVPFVYFLFKYLGKI